MRTDTKIFQTKGIALKFSMSGAKYEKRGKKKKKKSLRQQFNHYKQTRITS